MSETSHPEATLTHILCWPGERTLCHLLCGEVNDLSHGLALMGKIDEATCGVCLDAASRNTLSPNYKHVERMQIVDICIRRPTDGKFLAVTNRKHDGWTLPGGKVDPGESAAEAAVRELYEETGLYVLIDDLRNYAGFFEHTWRGTPIRCYSFLVDWSVLKGQAPKPQEDGTKILWVERDELLCPQSGCLAPAYYGWMMGKLGW